ncbi:carbon storage regulator CsrA [Paenibacillus sp. TRM 82003]|uniref:carbon storage regulator CsrA n=1 Tax=Kineococcus sp. TRM81007 TaxID=2925831 RepID=UPI001F5AC138|nr:carbon storage regulator CsrA [Kineococcus sp. TRM81007]MCI2240589.1 carbon storage regulator CsrA [Kineococcus sp. TRM81007]MCI3925489.1 carbon storage regulator CsrA [Paenibacillus sp. TRM 82003]
MLVLTRKAGESVVIGDEVVVRVLEVRGDVVRVGIEAPRDVQVHRQEVYEAVREANVAAAAASEEAVSALQNLVRRTGT